MRNGKVASQGRGKIKKKSIISIAEWETIKIKSIDLCGETQFAKLMFCEPKKDLSLRKFIEGLEVGVSLSSWFSWGTPYELPECSQLSEAGKETASMETMALRMQNGFHHKYENVLTTGHVLGPSTDLAI